MANTVVTTNNDEAIIRIIGKNLDKVRVAMRWTQARMAELTDISPAALGNYIKGYRLPDVTYLLRVCRIPELKEKNLTLTVDMLLSESFDPESSGDGRAQREQMVATDAKAEDMVGVYLCYYFDQVRLSYERDFREARALRYGVLVLFEDHETRAMRAVAAFYSQESLARARRAKKELEEIFAAHAKARDRAAQIREYAETWQASTDVYWGAVSFGKCHAFLHIDAPFCADRALIVLYLPGSRRDGGYQGGLGSVASVAQGTGQMPTAQKMIVSRYELQCSETEIASHLSLEPSRLVPDAEATELANLCQKLYRSDDVITSSLDDHDKIAIIGNRLRQLLQRHVEKHACCVGSVSEEENDAVCSLIQRFES